jgi:hypothetical protein
MSLKNDAGKMALKSSTSDWRSGAYLKGLTFPGDLGLSAVHERRRKRQKMAHVLVLLDDESRHFFETLFVMSFRAEEDEVGSLQLRDIFFGHFIQL